MVHGAAGGQVGVIAENVIGARENEKVAVVDLDTGRYMSQKTTAMACLGS